MLEYVCKEPLILELRAPAQLGRYAIVDTLGRGAMGVVYKGFDPVIARSVALKTIRRDVLDGDSAAELVGRFRNEAMASGRLNHPGIVAIYEYGEHDDTIFIVMEYVQGDSLRGYLSQRGQLMLKDVNDIMTQLLDALNYAHENGIVHRDVKPANIIVNPSGRIKITDFGIARINTSTMTQAGMVVGTPSYMAPEQYTGLAVDGRADVFSAGVVLYELLTGVKPFEGSTQIVSYKICHEPHRAPSELNGALPKGLDQVVGRALAKKPQDRFLTASEFCSALCEVIERHEASAEEPTLIHAGSPFLQQSAAVPELSSLAVTGWQPGTLASLEAVLASFVGPLARTLVKRHAAKSFALSELQEKLSLAIEDPTDRAAFMTASQPLFEEMAHQMTGTAMPTVEEASTAPNILSQDVLNRVAAELTVFLGPIAKILVKKTSPLSRDALDLYQRLAEHLSSDADKAEFLKLRAK